MKKVCLPFIVLNILMLHLHAQTWVLKNSIPGASRKNALSFTAGGSGYFGFGAQSGPDSIVLRQYNPLSDSWSPVSSVPHPFSPAQSVGIGANGYLGLGNTANGPSQLFYGYNPASDTWTGIMNFPSPFVYQAASFSLNGMAYLAGGAWPGTKTAKDSCYAYDPSANTWQVKARLPVAVRDGCGFVYNGLGYCVLGKLNADSVSRGVYIYHPGSDNWTTGSPYPGKVSGYKFCHFVYGNAVYFCNDSAQLWQYLPASDQWTRLPDTPFRKGGATFVLNGIAYVIAEGTTQIWKFCPARHVNAGADVQICKGGQTILHGSGDGAATFSWKPTTGLSNPNIYDPVASPGDTLSYILTVTDTIGCQEQDSVRVLVNPLPVVQVSATHTNICLGDTISLLATGGVNYIWSPSTALSNPNISSPRANPVQTLTYKVTVSTLQNCSSTDSLKIVVNPLPHINKHTSHAVCKGFASYIQLSGAKTYLWSPAASLFSDTASFQRAFPLVNTTYTIVATDSNGCRSTDTLFMRVNPVPVIHMLNDSVRLCAGDSVKLEVNGTATYNWLPTGNFNGSSDSIIHVAPPTSATYTVFGANSFHCRTESTAFVEVISLPQPVITLNSNILQSSASSGNQWYLNGVAVNGATNQTDSVSQNGTYRVCVQTQGCVSCSAPISVIVTSSGVQTYLNDFNFRLFPNPASSSVILSYDIPSEEMLSIELYAANGQYIKNLFTGKSSEGLQRMEFETGQLKSGFYTIFLKISDKIVRRKLIILK